MKLFWVAASLLTANVGLVAIYVVAPDLREPVFGEDRGVELTTALFFLAAFAIGVLRLAAHSSQRYRPLLATAAGLGLLGFLDEISFGARLFDWSMPALPGGGELDGAHDLIILIYRAMSAGELIVAAALAAVIVSVAIIYIVRWRDLQRLSRQIAADSACVLFALFVFALSVAVILDTEAGFLRRLSAVEEIAELNAALALFASTLVMGSLRIRRWMSDLQSDLVRICRVESQWTRPPSPNRRASARQPLSARPRRSFRDRGRAAPRGLPAPRPAR